MKCKCGGEINPCSPFMDCPKCRSLNEPAYKSEQSYPPRITHESWLVYNDDSKGYVDYISLAEHETVLRLERERIKELIAFLEQMSKRSSYPWEEGGRWVFPQGIFI